MNRELVLQVSHTLVGVNYLGLSIIFGAAVLALVQYATHSDRGLRWPSWWVRHSTLILFAGVLGSAAFLAGCGIHHLHLAFETIPHAVHQGPLAIDVFVSDGAYAHHLIITLAQVIGGWLAIGVAVLMWLAVRQRLPEGGQ